VNFKIIFYALMFIYAARTTIKLPEVEKLMGKNKDKRLDNCSNKLFFFFRIHLVYYVNLKIS